MRPTALLPCLLLATACHAKFKKEAPTLGAVRTQAVVSAPVDVELGKLSGNDVVSAVVNVVQEVSEVGPEQRIARAVDLDRVNRALQNSFAETLGSGPPFGTTQDPKAALLQIEVVRWGLQVPYLGAPGIFNYDLNIRIYKPDGDRVYSAGLACNTGVGNPPPEARVLGTVNNLRQLEQMSDREIEKAFVSVARWCGTQLVTQMRRHAG
jgi:hypothetical protein